MLSERAQHVVLFRFPKELTPQEEEDMFSRVRAWPDAIPGFTGLRIGRDVSGRSAGWQYLLLTEFESEEAHQAYYSHPTHVEFNEWIGARGPEVARIDYALTSKNLIV